MRIFLAFKSILFTVLVPGTVVFYLPCLILGRSGCLGRLHDAAFAFPGMAFLLAGSAIYIRCTWDFAVSGLGTPAPIDPPKNLVVTGFYRWTRNPMYLGVVLILLAEALFFLDRGLSIYVAGIAIAFHIAVVVYEEPILRGRFGPSYAHYCRHVPRWGIARSPFTPATD